MQTYFKSLFILFFIAFFSPLFAESDEESGHEDQREYLLYKDIYLYSDKKENWTKNPTTYFNAIFPVLIADSENDTVDNFNTLVQDFLTNERSQFKNAIAASGELQKTLPSRLKKNNLHIDYASLFVRGKQNNLLSIRFSAQQYIGGMAHPTLQHYTLNYNLSTGSLIELSSLFKPDSNYLVILSQIVNDALSKKLKENFIRDGIKPTLDNFDHWNLKSDGILFTFDEGQVAPRVYGTQTVLVPYRSIPGLLSSDTIISHCANKKSRCLASSVLTGGFLDEAHITSSSRKAQETYSAA